MACRGCSPPATGQEYATECASAALQPLAPDSVLMQYAAQAGARSSDFTMCLAMAFLITRRLLYWKRTPGDCGSPAQVQGNLGLGIGSGLGGAASVDPEPVSKGILSGIAIIGDLFGAHHAQAVATEQMTLCSVSVQFNSLLVQIEQAVKGGQISPDQASAYLQQANSALDSTLAGIAKQCDAACGFRIGMRALVSFMSDIGFPALAPSNPVSGLFPTPPVASPGAPGTYNPPPASTSPFPPPSRIFSGGNAGFGPTSTPSLPFSIDPGTILIIGGVAYVASRAGAA